MWSTIQAEAVNILLIVGDAFGRPLVDELERHDYDMSSMLMVVSGGAALSSGVKNRILELLPSVGIMDGLGASETGQQATQVSGAGAEATTGTFTPSAGMCIVSEDLSTVLEPTDQQLGWLAQRGRVPLGYLGDEAKTARTFPVIDGERYSVPGDRARFTPDGLLELQGRDSVTINSGGEKIFAEEVEAALMRTIPRSTTWWWPGARASAGATRSSRSCSSATARSRRSTICSTECEQPHRPLQAAEGLRVRRPGRAQPGRQGRLPLGPRAGHQVRRLISASPDLGRSTDPVHRPDVGRIVVRRPTKPSERPGGPKCRAHPT